ncbi:MAG: polysaccharide deacetylase family protein, partial [Candidatus Cloacimonetes bacterium]|nr:polysaccharide deacetylase family protein [Candidatus Cloacimonadota bacterium]
MKNKYALLTNDVETTSIWFNDLRDATGEKVLIEGMPRLLDLYAKYNVRSTFFYTAYIANLYPEVVKKAVEAGHEIGSHGKSHTKENGFDIMPYEKQIRHLEY